MYDFTKILSSSLVLLALNATPAGAMGRSTDSDVHQAKAPVGVHISRADKNQTNTILALASEVESLRRDLAELKAQVQR
ncbi:MAG: hypothetical protein U1E83_06405 [Methylotetracoccus sp.]